MARYICSVCGYAYDEETEGTPWSELPTSWVCPLCGADRSLFLLEAAPAVAPAPIISIPSTPSSSWRCSICGYLHRGDTPPGRCPVCQADADLFSAVDDTGVPLPELPLTAPIETVSDLLIETMLAWGITHVFGMVGHSNLGLAEAIRRRVEAGRLHYVGVRHEGAASFAASAFAKLTGRPAACLSIAGPGATNLLTGLWDAKMDRAPVLALTGQVETAVLGPGAFQEIDLGKAFAAVAGFGQPVLSTSDPSALMALALKHALVQREVAHLIVPDEVQTLLVTATVPLVGPRGRIPDRAVAPSTASLEAAIEALLAARRPALILGYGCRTSLPEVKQLLDLLGAPVMTTFKAKGFLHDDHPLACGVLGRSGTPLAAQAMAEADLLLVLGASFSKHTGIRRGVRTIQVDFDPLALARFHEIELPILGELGITAGLLTERLSRRGFEPVEDRRAELQARRENWRAEKVTRAAKDRGRGLASALVCETLSKLVPEDAVLAVDVGNHAYSFGRYFECHKQSVLLSGYLGSIGFGYPAALGAVCAAPERKVVALTGDGGFAQYLAELCTAVKYRLPITHVLFDNGQLGKISLEQQSEGLPVWETDLVNPDFASYADGCGARGFRVERREELAPALTEALAHPGPSLVAITTDPELV